MEKFKFLSSTISFITELRKEAPEMPVQMLQVFLEICRNEGQSGIDIQNKLGITRSSTSRLLATLAEGMDSTRPGFKWLEWRLDPTDARAKLYYPTTKGKEILGRIAEAAA